MSEVTIIITSSFIPSHPNTYIIDAVINSIYNNIIYDKIDNLKILIACDGLKLNTDNKKMVKYHKYIDNLKNKWKDNENIKIILNNKFGHLVGNIKNVFSYVETDYILIVQHDLMFVSQLNLNDIIDDLKKYPELKHVRFNKRNNIKAGWDKTKKFASKIIKTEKNSYILTESWSDQNHICKSSYYQNIVFKEVIEKTFMERILNNKAKGFHDKYGTFIYGYLGMDKIIVHLDGSETRRGNIGNETRKEREKLK